MSSSFKLTKKEIETLLTAGSMAPSGANAQPWRVKVFPDNLKLYFDPKRSASFIDVGKTASLFGLGCFLENIEVAAEELSLKYSLSFNFSNLNKTIVTMKFVGRNEERGGSRAYLYPFIKERVSNRQLYDGSMVDAGYIKQIQKDTSDHNKNLRLAAISQQAKKVLLAKVLGRADVIRMTNRKAYTQMIQEFRWSPEEVKKTRDGLDLRTLEMPKNMAKIFTLIHKHHQIINMLPRRVFVEISKPMIEGSSHVHCLYTTRKLTPEIMFEAGRIIERIWLKTTSKKLSFHPWTIVTFFIFRMLYHKGEGFSKEEINELKSIRSDLNQIFNLKNSEVPIFIFRISRAKKPSARSLRLNWKEFTEFA